MTGKTAWVLALALFASLALRAQDAPAIPAGQEASDADMTGRPKVKVRDYPKWQFNIGGGANLPSGTTRTYVRGGGGVATAGLARNANKYVGLRAEFWWENLPLRSSALALAQASGATSGVYSVSLDPVFNIPVTAKYSGFLLVGPSFYHRYGSLNSPTIPPGSACNGFYSWWTYCPTSLPSDFAKTSQNEFGLNIGGGVARKIGQRAELYLDWRYQHGSHKGISTNTKPITIGIRW